MESIRRGFPGITSVKDLVMKQEQPPPGGFPAIRYARRLPSTGPTGATLFAVGAVVSAYGFYNVGVTNQKRRAIREELMAARKHVYPYLQAEEDIKYQTRREHWEKVEETVMSDVPGWEVGKCVYKTREWVPPMPKFGIFRYMFDEGGVPLTR
eukprot:TRINITY_DN27416_c0_g1_i4.p2 TRINITY_DN27416_c0_g1~~TRINITY_DN27416_c0_g1_i4.p2  ORF type:complete len:153 (-),score=16.99 TRINITY_DN27416_c0_g1_i4:483-941(-)